jgi:putative transposase
LYNNKESRISRYKFWGDHFWSPSYFLSTAGNVTIDILKEYIENQRTEQE